MLEDGMKKSDDYRLVVLAVLFFGVLKPNSLFRFDFKQERLLRRG
jgi:hypothetical protein